MAGKLNQVAVKDYAEQFAQTVCDAHYQTHADVKGEQIMGVTPIKQLNLLVVKNLFEQWQEETENIKSPFFDYEKPEIAEAMEKLMNLLSRNISVKRAYFEPLLIGATEETLRLLLSPYLFYEQEFEKLGMRFHLEEDFLPLTKYIKTHQKLLNKLIDGLGTLTDTEGFIEVSKACQKAETIIKENLEFDDPKPALRDFHQVRPLRLQDLVAKPGDDLTKHKAPIPQTVKRTPEPQPPKESPTSAPAPVEQPVMNAVLEKEPPQKTVHERLIDEEPPAQPTVLERQQKHAGESLETLIPLNRKMAFIDQLFKGDQEVFRDVVNHIDHCANYHEAIMYIREKYFYKYDWDLGNAEVQEFYSIIEKKFD